METGQMIIDSHQHFWQYNRHEYGWITPEMGRLRSHFLPSDLAPQMASAGVSATVAVQARQTQEETAWLLQLARENSLIAGVVGWVDLRSDGIAEQLELLTRDAKLRGVRHVIQDEADDNFMLRADFLNGIALLKRFGLTYDLLLFPRHLPIAYELVKRFADQRFVLDHIAKPPVKTGVLEPWAGDLKRLAECDNVYCKISGLVTEGNWETWSAQDFDPYLDVVLNAFGPDRLMIGSDWPVCNLAASYKSVIDLATGYLSRLSTGEQNAIYQENPQAFYGLKLEPNRPAKPL